MAIRLITVHQTATAQSQAIDNLGRHGRADRRVGALDLGKRGQAQGDSQTQRTGNHRSGLVSLVADLLRVRLGQRLPHTLEWLEEIAALFD